MRATTEQIAKADAIATAILPLATTPEERAAARGLSNLTAFAGLGFGDDVDADTLLRALTACDGLVARLSTPESTVDVGSATRPGVTYRVALRGAVALRCTCPDWKRHAVRCKHMASAEQLAGQSAPLPCVVSPRVRAVAAGGVQ